MKDILASEEAKALGIYLPLLRSQDEFPIPATVLESVYKRKDNLKTALIRNFILDKDYQLSRRDETNIQGGRPIEDIRLSVPCAKELLLTQRTIVGKRIRRYFILAEEVLRRDLLSHPQTLSSMRKEYQAYDKLVDDILEEEVKLENHYQQLLETSFGDRILPRTSAYGTMDIHLTDKIIEIKRWNVYKHALGQLLAYHEGCHKTLQVAFFGDIPDAPIVEMIVSLFSKYNILVTYFDCDDVLKTLNTSSLAEVENELEVNDLLDKRRLAIRERELAMKEAARERTGWSGEVAPANAPQFTGTNKKNVTRFFNEMTSPGGTALVVDLFPAYLNWVRWTFVLPASYKLLKKNFIATLNCIDGIQYSRFTRQDGRKGGGQQGVKRTLHSTGVQIS